MLVIRKRYVWITVMRGERNWLASSGNVTIHLYPGTSHAFFDETVPTHYDAAAASLSWERTISFMRDHLAA